MLASLITRFQMTTAKGKAAEIAWITDLEHMDHLDALKVTTEKIPSQPLDAEKQAQRQADDSMKALLLIDDSSYTRLQAIAANFMRVVHDDTQLESRVVGIVYDYHRRLYLAYKQLIDFIIQQKLDITMDQLLLLLARTVHVACAMNKWRYFQDQAAPVGTWKQLNELVRVAEKLTLLEKNVLLYEGDERQTTLSTLLVHGYMLDTLSKASFSRQQIELTSQVLKRWVANSKIRSEFVKEEHTFLINLKLDKGPSRARDFSFTPDCRFWKSNTLVANIQIFLSDAETNKPLQRFNLNSLATATVLVELFKKLLPEWKSAGYVRQRRRENRTPVNKVMGIHSGVEDILKKLAPNTSIVKKPNASQDATSFELRVAMHAPTKLTGAVQQRKAESDAWLIVDESKGGLGASLSGNLSEWVEPGKLVGFSSLDQTKQFLVAEIKSVKKQVNGRYRIGVEVLSERCMVAQVSQFGGAPEQEKEVVDGYFVDFSELGGSVQPQFSGLYLPEDSENDQLPMLIVPKAEYLPATQYSLNLDGNERHILAEQAISHCDGWVRVQVKAIS